MHPAPQSVVPPLRANRPVTLTGWPPSHHPLGRDRTKSALAVVDEKTVTGAHASTLPLPAKSELVERPVLGRDGTTPPIAAPFARLNSPLMQRKLRGVRQGWTHQTTAFSSAEGVDQFRAKCATFGFAASSPPNLNPLFVGLLVTDVSYEDPVLATFANGVHHHRVARLQARPVTRPNEIAPTTHGGRLRHVPCLLARRRTTTCHRRGVPYWL